MPEPSDGVPEPVVASLVGLEEYLGSEMVTISKPLSFSGQNLRPVEGSDHSLGQTARDTSGCEAGEDPATVTELRPLLVWLISVTLFGHSRGKLRLKSPGSIKDHCDQLCTFDRSQLTFSIARKIGINLQQRIIRVWRQKTNDCSVMQHFNPVYS